MTEGQHQEALEFFATEGLRRTAEKAAWITREHAESLRHFGCWDMNLVSCGDMLWDSSCVHCRQERKAQHVLSLGGIGAAQSGWILTRCLCCRECYGVGFRWARAKPPAGISQYDHDWKPPIGWKYFEKRACECVRKRKPKASEADMFDDQGADL